MKTIHLNIPDQANLDINDVSRILAVKLYEAGKLTLAQAAQTVSLFNYPASDIAKDAAQA